MGKIEHLQFLVLMIPTFLMLAAAAVSMADLAFPASGVAGSGGSGGGQPGRCTRLELGREDSPVE